MRTVYQVLKFFELLYRRDPIVPDGHMQIMQKQINNNKKK